MTTLNLTERQVHIREMTSKETIQQLKEDIAILQEKLQKLEEAEKEPDMMLLRQGKVDIVDYDRRTFYRIEYTDSFSGIYKWYEREKTFSNLMPIQDNSEVFVLLEEFYQHQVMKQKEEYPYKKYTPEETEKSLKDAMKKAKEDGVFDDYVNGTTSPYTTCSTERSYGNCGIMRDNWEAKE
jgi:hypothetical protein